MSLHHLSMPWGHGRPGPLYSTPGSLLVKMRPGEGPPNVPALTDVEQGRSEPAGGLDGGMVDRLVGHYSDRRRVTLLHRAAAGDGRYDLVEQLTGLARTYRIDVDREAAVADLVRHVRSLATVEHATHNYLTAVPMEAHPADSDVDAAWSSRVQIGGPEAMAYEPGDPSVVVAVVDTGAALGHPELTHRLRRGRDLVSLVGEEVATGVRLLAEPSGGDPEDNVGHGTSCAAIVGALGRLIPPGLAGECGLLPIRVLAGALMPGKPQPVGIGALSDIDRGVKDAIDLGAVVISMSFGTPEDELDPHDPMPHEDVVRYGLARGCIMVAAAGNSGAPERYAPASIEGVIAVGAADPEGAPAPFSTSGPHVALLAPGVRVVSASLDGYSMVSGTSFAAPFVSAAAALLLSHARSRAYALDSGGVKRILQESATPPPRGAPAGHGAGVLNAYAALKQLNREIDQSMSKEHN
jgi:subtilisin family serine protease